MYVAQYDAKDTSIVIDGTYITGLGEDMISAEKDEDFFSTSVGAQGDVVTSEINNSLGTVTVYIQPTSPQKAFLMGLAKRREPFPLWAVNKKLGERFGGVGTAHGNQLRLLSPLRHGKSHLAAAFFAEPARDVVE